MSTTPETPLPNWAEMSDLDKGAALLFLHTSDYPCRYFDHPALTALEPRRACEHAAALANDAEALTEEEHERLYDAALDASNQRWHKENAIGGAS
jgi:hypothetical protein